MGFPRCAKVRPRSADFPPYSVISIIVIAAAGRTANSMSPLCRIRGDLTPWVTFGNVGRVSVPGCASLHQHRRYLDRRNGLGSTGLRGHVGPAREVVGVRHQLAWHRGRVQHLGLRCCVGDERCGLYGGDAPPPDGLVRCYSQCQTPSEACQADAGRVIRQQFTSVVRPGVGRVRRKEGSGAGESIQDGAGLRRTWIALWNRAHQKNWPGSYYGELVNG
jgi:hypothetical protein